MSSEIPVGARADVMAFGRWEDVNSSAGMPAGEPEGAGREKRCRNCGRALTRDEIGLHKKLFNRAADSFLCISCSAEYFGVGTQLLEEKIRQFKEMGCTLFERQGTSP